MITTLSRLTMRDYIELVCGDVSVIKEKGETRTNEELQQARKALIYEYSRLSDGASTKAMLTEQEKRQRAVAEHTLFQVLTNMLALEMHGQVRGILREYGIARSMDNKQLAAEVERLLKRSKTTLAKVKAEKGEEKKPPSADEIRAQFDRQAASLMTYFKFQIDLRTITASQFACMSDQARREIKAKLAAMSRK